MKNYHGTKILLKGNHDYWWNTLNKMNNFFKVNNINTIKLLYNNSYLYNGYIICGTRGWIDSSNDEDIKILKREIIRLKLSIEDGIQKYGENKKIIVNMHYPPFIEMNNNISFIDLMKQYNVKYCIYGHIHGKNDKEITNINDSKIFFKLVSCDYLNFKLYKLF